MILNLLTDSVKSVEMPRTCGDDPIGAEFDGMYDTNAPHLRG